MTKSCLFHRYTDYDIHSSCHIMTNQLGFTNKYVQYTWKVEILFNTPRVFHKGLGSAKVFSMDEKTSNRLGIEMKKEVAQLPWCCLLRTKSLCRHLLCSVKFKQLIFYVPITTHHGFWPLLHLEKCKAKVAGDLNTCIPHMLNLPF